MTNWGDYTPGPWVLREDLEGLGFIQGPLHKQGHYFNSADAHLISKAYLIPRLEAALTEWLDTPYFDTADDWAAWCSPFRARVLNVLAELRDEEPQP